MKIVKITDPGCPYCYRFSQYKEVEIQEVLWDAITEKLPFYNHLENKFESVEIRLPLFIAEITEGKFVSFTPESVEQLRTWLTLIGALKTNV